MPITTEEIYQASKEQAEKDLQNGIIGKKTFGLIRSPHLLKEAYKERGVRLMIIAGDCIDKYIKADAAGYNSVMEPEINKISPNFHEEARARYQELRQEKFKKVNSHLNL